ncbi:hypothetical protein P692DRAFT_20840908 [Suillus brevipes Sb2]|nr:hypothetical protein P692DRAFT_20840908 [Suillus brevipes Sb2]
MNDLCSCSRFTFQGIPCFGVQPSIKSVSSRLWTVFSVLHPPFPPSASPLIDHSLDDLSAVLKPPSYVVIVRHNRYAVAFRDCKEVEALCFVASLLELVLLAEQF